MNRLGTVTYKLYTVGLNWSDVPFKNVIGLEGGGGGGGQKQI